MTKKMDYFWDDNPVDVSQEANFIWSIANKLRGVYMPDKYGDVIIPMTIIRRFECTLEPTKDKVLQEFEKDPDSTEQVLCKKSGFQFYNTSKFSLAELCTDPDHLASNFKSYINGFSANVQDILKELKMSSHIEAMDEGGCLYSVVEAFSTLDVSPNTFDSIKMGYIFENLIGRFFQNVDAGQYYTGRDIIKCLVSILISEGCDDIFDDHKIITVCDQACGTGGMLSTAYTYLKHYNPTCDVRLFGQEFMGVSYAVGLAEMLIKGQDARNFLHADTFKKDHFENQKMRFVIMNPPFGTSWAGKNAKEGQEEAVKKEYRKGMKGRWGAGLPSSSDSQLLFMQSAIAKMDDKYGRAAIIENGSSLYAGDVASGESQIRRWMLDEDIIEAIIALPSDLFYNTGIQTYVWILSKNKRMERKGKVQLIDASSFYQKLRKPLGDKKNELDPKDREKITKLYTDFKENEYCKIFDNEEFLYREYTTLSPLQKSYSINQERINHLITSGLLDNYYNESECLKLLKNRNKLSNKEKNKLAKYEINKEKYNEIINSLLANISDEKYMSFDEFVPKLNSILTADKSLIEKIAEGLSINDIEAKIVKDKKGNVVYDKKTKSFELVPYKTDVNEYMKNNVIPFVPNTKWFFEGDDENAKFYDDIGKEKIRIGAEIPMPTYFYKHHEPKDSEIILKDYLENINKNTSTLLKTNDSLKEYSNYKPTPIDWVKEIPNEWRIVPNKYVMSKIKEISPEYNGEDILSLTINGVVVRDLEAGGKMPASFDGYQKIEPGNLLMCLYDYDVTPRCIGLIKNSGLTSPSYSQFKLNEGYHAPYYFYYYLMIDNTKELLHLAKNLRHSFTEDQLGAINVPVPKIEEQKKIAEYLDSKCEEIDSLILKKKEEVTQLEEYKKSLIYEVVTGKKKI